MRLFGNMVFVATGHNLDMREVLKNPPGPLLWAMSNCDCTLKETNKSTIAKIVNEYGQEIPQSQTADNPVALRGRAAQPSRDTRKTN